MKSVHKGFAAVVCLAIPTGLMLAACDGDDTTIALDGGPVDAGASDVTVMTDSGALTDSGGGTDAQEGTPPWLLLSLNYPQKSEMTAFSVSAKHVDGTLTYPGFIGATSTQGGSLYLMEQQNDVIVKLDPKAPWKGGPSWNVRLDDAYDGGKSYADPVAVVPVGNKAYVLRFNRNKIAVLDTTQTGDGGAPTKTIDLSSLLGGTDGDGHVDMSAAVYVPSKQRIYVLLGNWDLTKTPAVQTIPFTPCLATKPFVIAIDATNDALVSLGGTGPGGGIELPGYNPLFGGMIYDATRDRFLVVQAGCNVDGGDAGPGALLRREVDQIGLTSGAASVALDLTSYGYPSAMTMLDADHMVLGFDFGYQAFPWTIGGDAGLGAQIPNAPDLFLSDGKGNLLGTHTDFFSDGGSASSIVSVQIADGGVTTLGPVPFTDPSAFPPAGIDLWSSP